MPQRTTGPAIRLRATELREHAALAGLTTEAQIAAHLGMSHTTVWRMLSGGIAPGESSIAAILAGFPDLKFEDLFEVVSPAAAEGAA